MSTATFISIDQNSQPLWDTVPKLAAAARRGLPVTHYVEDIDVAFTRHGAVPGDAALQLARERVFRGGGLEWGAALFYTDFLGRLPLDVRALEPFTGWSTAALSRRLGVTVDELYDRYSPSDNWQLVGASYVDSPDCHRVIGDVTVAEARPHLLRVLRHAREDAERAFPEAAPRQRIGEWFDRETKRLQRLLTEYAEAGLANLYRGWCAHHIPGSVTLGLTSRLFDVGRATASSDELLTLFATRYDTAAALYNDALAETDTGLNALRIDRGELPFFVVIEQGGRLVRTNMALVDGRLTAMDRSWRVGPPSDPLPLQQMARDGVKCIAGKALVLVLQVRLPPHSHALLLPRHGSLYMPAAYAFERKLAEAGLLTTMLCPVYRVRFDSVRHWADCQTRICLPQYLHGAFSNNELSAAQFAAELPATMTQARKDLDQARTETGRRTLLARLSPSLHAQRDELNTRRAVLARTEEGRQEAGQIWDRVKEMDRELLSRLVAWTVRNLRILDLDTFDSRGALLPWHVALGGEALYDDLLQNAEFYPEENGLPHR